MPRFNSIRLGLLFLVLAAAPLFAQDKLVVFGGYSYLRPPVSVVESCLVCAQPALSLLTSNSPNLNGWELSATYRFLPFLGIAADVSGNHGSTISGFSSSAHQHTFLFGPEVSLPSRISPFAHVLVGGSRQDITSGTQGGAFIVLPGNNSAFATAIGGGIDIKLVPHLWIRPIQIDYLVTRFSGNTQNQPRVSAGIVFHF